MARRNFIEGGLAPARPRMLRNTAGSPELNEGGLAQVADLWSRPGEWEHTSQCYHLRPTFYLPLSAAFSSLLQDS